MSTAMQTKIEAKSTSAHLAPTHTSFLQRKCAEGEFPKRHEKRLMLQRRSTGEAEPSEVPPIVHEVLSSPGQPLDKKTRAFFEPRFGHDFSQVRVHADARAAESAQAVNAVAYTVGRNVVFGAKQHQLETAIGRQILAHELTHVVQQSRMVPTATNRLELGPTEDVFEHEASEIAYNDHSFKKIQDMAVLSLNPVSNAVRIQRQLITPLASGGGFSGLLERDRARVFRKPTHEEMVSEMINKIRSTPAYNALDAANVTLTNDVITEIRKRSIPDQYHFLSKLKLLFDTPVKLPATISAETKVSTVREAEAEKRRLKKPTEAKKARLEETASAAPKRTWVAIKGKFGGGTYYVDRSSPTDIVVKADILLTPKGTGTQKDVDAIKSMEDGIEKAASNKGYLVDIRFVNSANPDTFHVDVDPQKWETATNWAGGEPWGYAHELHHLFAFDLDRYNYIEAHASNESLEIPDRLSLFLDELKKPANYNDPTSIMNRAAHPNDDDACRAAGLDVKICVPARAAARAAGKL